MAKKQFKGVWIPAEVWTDERLTPLEKMILAAIISMDNGEGGCHASNDYLATYCQCAISKVSATISKLSKLEYISIHSRGDGIRILEAGLLNFRSQPSKFKNPPLQNLEPALLNFRSENENEPSYYRLTKSINKERDNARACEANRSDDFVPPTVEEVRAYCEERKNGIKAERFVSYYECRLWMLSKDVPVTDWKATVRAWESNGLDTPKEEKPSSFDEDDFWNAAVNRSYDGINMSDHTGYCVIKQGG